MCLVAPYGAIPRDSESLRWPDSRESIRRFARIAWFSRIVSGFPNCTPFLRIALRAAKKVRIAGLRRFARIARTLWKWVFSRDSIRANRPDSRCQSLDHLSETILAIPPPLLCAMGFFGVSTWLIGCDTPPPPVSERFPLGEHTNPENLLKQKIKNKVLR